MKIAIDCRSLDWKHSGIARYLDNILKELATLDKANEYYLLFPRKSKASYHFAKSKTIYFLANDFIYKFWKTPKFLKKEKIDIYWSPTQELPFWKPKYTRYFITIHDAAMEHDISSQTLKVKILHFLMVYKFSAGIADVIFTDSNYSKNDIANSLKINKSKIVVTFIGVDKKFKPIEKQSARLKLNKKFGIDSQYIFYINTGKPKNLLNAYAQLINNKWKNIDINLVTLGKSVNKE
jgi:hypothetical protein